MASTAADALSSTSASSGTSGPGESTSSGSDTTDSTSSGTSAATAVDESGDAPDGLCVLRRSFPELEGSDASPVIADVDGNGISDVWRRDDGAGRAWNFAGFEWWDQGEARSIQGASAEASSLRFGDVNGDGFDDALVFVDDERLWIPGSANGLLAAEAEPLGQPEDGFVLTSDLDGDGALDAIGNAGFGEWALYAGDGAGELIPSSVVEFSPVPRFALRRPNGALWIFAMRECIGFCAASAELIELQWEHPALEFLGSSKVRGKGLINFDLVAWSDFLADETPEVLALDEGVLQIWLGSPGEELDVQIVREGVALAFTGDFDGDGDDDVLTADAAGAPSVQWASTDGFSEPEPVAGNVRGQVVGVADFVGDGLPTALMFDGDAEEGLAFELINIVPCS